MDLMETFHPGGLHVESHRDRDTVILKFPSSRVYGEQELEIERDVLESIVRQHSLHAHDKAERRRQQNDALRIGLSAHPFELDDSSSGLSCTRMVMRGGGGDQCGLPASDPIHTDKRNLSEESRFEQQILEEGR